jgi:hypothetical protein
MPESGEPALDQLLSEFYSVTVGPWWDEARKLVDERYETIEFHFAPLPSKNFTCRVSWTKDHLTGYLESWSAVQAYMKAKGSSPVGLIRDALNGIWKEGSKEFVFPLYLRAGKVSKP